MNSNGAVNSNGSMNPNEAMNSNGAMNSNEASKRCGQLMFTGVKNTQVLVAQSQSESLLKGFVRMPPIPVAFEVAWVLAALS